MEDAHIIGSEVGDSTFFGVFDGHGGAEVARYVARHMMSQVESDWDSRPETSLKRLFHRMDEMLRDPAAAEEIASLKNGAKSSEDGGVAPRAAAGRASDPAAGGGGDEKVSVKEAFALF